MTQILTVGICSLSFWPHKPGEEGSVCTVFFIMTSLGLLVQNPFFLLLVVATRFYFPLTSLWCPSQNSRAMTDLASQPATASEMGM